MSPLVGDQSIEHDGHQMPASAIWSPAVIEDIQLKAQLGRYRLQGFSTHRRVPSFDDLIFVPCPLSRVPLEGYRERCETRTVLGSRYASKPIVLDRPITISGMSYGALSKTAKVALGKAATRLGISTTTGDGGMLLDEREASHILVYQVLPSRYGFNTEHLKARAPGRAEPLRLQHRPSQGRGRDRGCDRSGSQARHRGRAARIQSVRCHRQAAHPAARRRSAQPGAPPRFHRP